MTREQMIQNLINGIMEEISRFEAENQKLSGLEISSALIGYLLSKNPAIYILEINKNVSDAKVVVLCNRFLERIELFVELQKLHSEPEEGETAKFIVSKLLEKTSRLGCLQVQNPKRFDPCAKMTGQ